MPFFALICSISAQASFEHAHIDTTTVPRLVPVSRRSTVITNKSVALRLLAGCPARCWTRDGIRRHGLGMGRQTHRDDGGLAAPLLGQELMLRQFLLHALWLGALLVNLRLSNHVLSGRTQVRHGYVDLCTQALHKTAARMAASVSASADPAGAYATRTAVTLNSSKPEQDQPRNE